MRNYHSIFLFHGTFMSGIACELDLTETSEERGLCYQIKNPGERPGHLQCAVGIPRELGDVRFLLSTMASLYTITSPPFENGCCTCTNLVTGPTTRTSSTAYASVS